MLAGPQRRPRRSAAISAPGWRALAQVPPHRPDRRARTVPAVCVGQLGLAVHVGLVPGACGGAAGARRGSRGCWYGGWMRELEVRCGPTYTKKRAASPGPVLKPVPPQTCSHPPTSPPVDVNVQHVAAAVVLAPGRGRGGARQVGSDGEGSSDIPPWEVIRAKGSTPPCPRGARKAKGHPRLMAEVMENGRPVVILDQISAILAPSPNLPRVCLTPGAVSGAGRRAFSAARATGQSDAQLHASMEHDLELTPNHRGAPYLVPDSTRPSMLGMSLWGMPPPLSWGCRAQGGTGRWARARTVPPPSSTPAPTPAPTPTPPPRPPHPCVVRHPHSPPGPWPTLTVTR